MTLYFSPLALKAWRAMITDVRGSVITTILREGEFMTLTEGLTFHLRHRRPDGTLEGIFVSDSREPEETANYLAERGAVLDGPLGVFLVMNDGTIQRRNNKDKSISIIEFSSYAFDLSTLSSQTSRAAASSRRADDRLPFQPRSGGQVLPALPGKFRAELHYRLTVAAQRPRLRHPAAGLSRPGRDHAPAALGDDDPRGCQRRRARRHPVRR